MKSRHQVPQYIAEFIGTFFLVFFGCGSVILSNLNISDVGSFVPIIFGAAVSIMIYAVGHISGAHFNPAVTIAFWSAKRFPAQRIPFYVLAQVSGALTASLVHLFLWGAEHTFGVTTFQGETSVALLMEFILSFALMFVIISVATDSRAVGELAGIAIGSTVAVCAFVGGPLTGASMNPARTLGPALVAQDFTGIWIYFVAPILGTVLATFVYEWIRCHKEAQDEKAHGCC